ncbi:hypothetical protein IID21_01620 [Patescibacteria group bacterium]|nr:hypothetical protein [Patescibacteria group bacterium]
MTKNTLLFVLPAIFLSFFMGRYFMPPVASHEGLSMQQMRVHFVSQKDDLHENMLADGDYRCCLEKPCTYCIEKTPGHGEGATCSCLEDVVEGRHPCGECIGEILEGHGNRFLAKYFASAIAEEVGDEHLETLKKIISQKYGLPPEAQL